MKKITTILAVLILGSFLVAGNAIAAPLLLSDILSVSTPYADTGAEAVMLTDTDGIEDDAEAFLFLESAGFADENTFGIYGYTVDGSGDVSLTGETLEVFNGIASPITSGTLKFDLLLGTVTNSLETANIGATFGFYLTTPQGYTFYTHTSLNTADSFDHALIFNTSDDEESDLSGSDVVIAFEDLKGGGDGDFNDLVVGLSNVAPAPVPEPATMLLFGTGLLGLAVVGRKKIKK